VRYTVDTWTWGTAAASSSAVNAGPHRPHAVDHRSPRLADAVAGVAQVGDDLVERHEVVGVGAADRRHG
jgi:hypothetical protein